MNDFVVGALALALTAAVVALRREVRLRRALERLVRMLLARWRNRDAEQQHSQATFDRNPDTPDGHGAAQVAREAAGHRC